jgi:hypothetical protein
VPVGKRRRRPRRTFPFHKASKNKTAPQPQNFLGGQRQRALL